MATYYVNRHAQNNGDHEVHKEGCRFLPDPANRVRLGGFMTCQGAVAAAAKHYRQVDGCYYCCRACHAS